MYSIRIQRYRRERILDITVADIKAKAKDLDVSGFSIDFVQDLTAAMAGESYLSIPEMRKVINDQLEDYKHILVAKPQGYCVVADKYVNTPEEWAEQSSKAYQEYALMTLEFMRNISPRTVPGTSPLDKAMNILWFLSSEDIDEPLDEDGGLNFAVAIPLMKEGKTKQRIQETLSEKLSLLHKLKPEIGEVEADMLELSSEKALPDEIFRKMKDVGFQILQSAMKIEGTNVKLQTTEAVDIEEDDEGFIIRKKVSRGLSDLGKTRIGKNSAEKHILGHERVKHTYEVTAYKPFVIMLVDVSGSMSCGMKQYQALGLLYYLTKKAQLGELDLYFSFFERKNYGFTHVTQDMNPTEWYKEISKTNFDKGVTDIGYCAVDALKQAKQYIDDTGLRVDRNQYKLVLVNDGEDDATQLTVEMLRAENAQLHAYILDSENQHLKMLAEATNGFYTQEL